MSTNTENLNKRKAELLDSQTLALNQSMEAKRKLTDAEEATFQASTKEIADIDQNIARFAAIAKSKTEVSLRRQSVHPLVQFARDSCADDSSVVAWFEATVKCITFE
jgi:oligoendopeptidase F